MSEQKMRGTLKLTIAGIVLTSASSIWVFFQMYWQYGFTVSLADQLCEFGTCYELVPFVTLVWPMILTTILGTLLTIKGTLKFYAQASEKAASRTT